MSVVEDLREQLSNAVAWWLKLEGQKALAMKGWGEKIKAVHEEIADLSRAIQDGGGVQGTIEELAEPSGEPTAEPEAEVASGQTGEAEGEAGAGLRDCRTCAHLERYHDHFQGECSLPNCGCEGFVPQPEL
jgi:hypothetical protein